MGRFHLSASRLKATVCLFLLAAAAAGCSCGDDPAAKRAPCVAGEECPTGLCAEDGLCPGECSDATCPLGTYCGAKGECASDCGPRADAGTCAEGLLCSPRGQCVTHLDGGGDVDCPDVFVDGSPVVPTVILLVDQSGSMTSDLDGNGPNDGDFTPPDRWDAVYDALVDPTSGVVQALDDKVRFGVTLYTWAGPSGYANMDPKPPAEACPRLTAVAPTLDNYTAIEALLDDNSPADDTPTAESVAGVAASFPPSDGPRVILLATDGDPDSCTDPDSNGDQGPRTASEAAVQAAYTDGIETYVLSVGTDATQSHLERLARAGQGQNLTTGAADPYITTTPEELVDAFESIIEGVRTCEFRLDGTVMSGAEADGDVVLNGTPLEYGVDWTLEGGNVVRLLGDSCTAFLEADDVVLSAKFPCGTVIL